MEYMRKKSVGLVFLLGTVVCLPNLVRAQPRVAREEVQFRLSGRVVFVLTLRPDGARRLVGHLVIPVRPFEGARHRGHLFLACGPHGVWIADLTRPSNPRLTVHLPLKGNVVKLAVQGDLLLVSTGRFQMRFFDVKDPKKPRPLDLDAIGSHLKGLTRSAAGKESKKAPLRSHRTDLLRDLPDNRHEHGRPDAVRSRRSVGLKVRELPPDPPALARLRELPKDPEAGPVELKNLPEDDQGRKDEPHPRR